MDSKKAFPIPNVVYLYEDRTILAFNYKDGLKTIMLTEIEGSGFSFALCFPYFLGGLEKLSKDTPIISEGAAFLPCLANEIGVDKTHYVCMVPSNEFQVHHYLKRLWVNDYLSSCSDKEKAFKNWMERDALFALSVLERAKEIGYATLIVDGTKSIEENFQFVVEIFGL